MYHIAESMVRWLAPILSFTAEEIWRYLPGEHGESVFLETWHNAAADAGRHDRLAGAHQLRARRVARAREAARAGSIGAPLDAEVDIYCAPAEFARFNALGEELRFLLITSEARVHEVAEHRRRRGAGDAGPAATACGSR